MARVVRILRRIEKRVRTPRKKLCIDIDTLDKQTKKEKRDWETTYREIKALYMLSTIAREVRHTIHGKHIYLEIDITELDCNTVEMLKIIFGDDPQRIELDSSRCLTGYWINVCFTSSETT